MSVNTKRQLETSFIHLMNKILGIDTFSSCHCSRYISVISPNFSSARYMDVASFLALGVSQVSTRWYLLVISISDLYLRSKNRDIHSFSAVGQAAET
jgi:hypothetical protein